MSSFLRSLGAVLLLAACAAGPVAAPASGLLTVQVTPPEKLSAERGFRRLEAGATATLYVPDSVSLDRPAPLLLLLHGAGGRGEGLARRFKAEADRRGFIILAPDSEGQTWDAVLSIASNRSRPPVFGEDVARIDSVLRETLSRYPIDPSKLAIAGFSDGAGYALSLGARNSALFHSIMAFSAGMMVAGDTGPPAKVFISHGTKDRILPIAISRDTLAPALRNVGFKVEFVTFNGDHELPDDVLAKGLDMWLGPAR